jgi:hypothetical protein
MGDVIGIALMVLLTTEIISALPQGDGLATATIPSSSVAHSDFTWISTWATETPGTDPTTNTANLDQNSQPQASATRLVSLHLEPWTTGSCDNLLP